MSARLADLKEPFEEIDRHFSRFIASFGLQAQPSRSDRDNRSNDLASLAAALLSRNIRNGHICLDLSVAPRDLDLPWPSVEEWKNALAKNRAIGGPESATPLVLDSANRLYLRRYWDYERSLAAAIRSRCRPGIDQGTGNGDAAPGSQADSPAPDRQEAAVQAALAHQLLIISGGPGTGKTTTVLKILRAFSQAAAQAGKPPIRVALSAPTGKAAARLQETLSGKLGQAHPGVDLQAASTLHRLLGTRRGSSQFHHHAGNPLPYDLIVVDEASMVPLTLMAKLFDAIPPRARVILLGDRDQLASVEPGSVLGDIAEAAGISSSPLRGHLVELQTNYRFGNDSAIYELCNAVREGNQPRSLEILKETTRKDLASSSTPAAPELLSKLREPILAGYSAYLQAKTPAEALERFAQFRVLAALRVGPFGVENLNRQIEAILRQEGLVQAPPAAAYAGKPILVTANDYSLRLFNGDIGILLPDPATGALLAWFASEEENVRSIAPARLPRHEPAFAMTVHKSQGSEFDHVLLVLPDKPSPVLTRELLYTGLTRARNRVEVWFNESVLRPMISTRIQRESGLRDRLTSGE